jgi:hypothetical protein
VKLKTFRSAGEKDGANFACELVKIIIMAATGIKIRKTIIFLLSFINYYP